MRELKFRAWSEHFGGMIYPDSDIYEIDVHANIVWRASADDEVAILMQHTGLKDKNGKEIYEGDVLSWQDDDLIPFKHTYPVVWGEYGDDEYVEGLQCWTSGNSPVSCLVSRGVRFGRGFKPKDGVEIIGNIYENEELLEK